MNEDQKESKHEALFEVITKRRNSHDLATIHRITSLIVKGLMAGSIIILSILVFYFAGTQRIVMQPPFKIDRPINLNFDEEIDRQTIERMGEVLTQVYKTVTPENVKKQHDKLLSLVPSGEYNKVGDMLSSDQRSIIHNQLVRSFFIDNIDVEKKGQIVVTGTEHISVQGKEISNMPMSITWFYNFTPVEGFVILGYKEEQKQ